jgi:hypothetical protein
MAAFIGCLTLASESITGAVRAPTVRKWQHLGKLILIRITFRRKIIKNRLSRRLTTPF